MISFRGFMFISTPSGFKPIHTLLKWVDCPTVLVTLEGSTLTKQLECSHDHLLGTPNFKFIPAKDSLHRLIKGKTEDFTVTGIKELGLRTCYDITVDGGCYYADSVLVHNSTISAIFLLHYVLFNSNKTVAILANKDSSAKEILLRVKVAYQNLPKFLQQGVTEWNKNSIELENGSRIIASGSSASSIRSASISVLFIDECLDGSTVVSVKQNNLEENLSLSDLFHRLSS